MSVVYSSGYKMVLICLMSNSTKYLFVIFLTSCIFSLKTRLFKSFAYFKIMLFIDSGYFCDCGQGCSMSGGLGDHQYLIVALWLTQVTSRKMNSFLSTSALLSITGRRASSLSTNAVMKNKWDSETSSTLREPLTGIGYFRHAFPSEANHDLSRPVAVWPVRQMEV